MRHGLIGLAALTTATLAGIAPSSAQHWQGNGTWCVQPPIGGGSWSCYYYSEAQCRGTIGYGSAASCVPNPAPDWARKGFKVPMPVDPYQTPRRKRDRDSR
jgi:hypothetical protein